MISELPPTHFAIARIVRTRGNSGEVLAELYTDFPARFSLLEKVWVEFTDGRRELFRLENTWQHKGRQVLKFEGIETISQAEALAGAWVEIDADQMVALPEGQYYDHDLIGCSVRDLVRGELGKIKEILRIAGNHQFLIEGPRGEFMIPAAQGICKEISIEHREVVVDLPEGLIDLNK